MLPKVGDTITYTFGEAFQGTDLVGRKIVISILSLDMSVCRFDVIGNCRGSAWDGNSLWGTHMFKSVHHGSWSTKENNIRRLLKAIDEN